MKTRIVVVPCWTLMLLLLSLTSVPSLAVDAPVSVVLTVEPSRTLLGIPVSLHVTATNRTDRDVVLPKKILLRVIPSVGEAFIAEWGFNQEHRFSGAELSGAFRLSPYEVQTVAFTAADFRQAPGWFVDPRLNVAGKYRLQALLVNEFSEEEIFHTPALQVELIVPVRFVSSEAVLSVEKPEGADALVWNRLREIARRHDATLWSPAFVSLSELAEVAKEAVERYPQSRYTPYVVPYYAVPDAQRLEAARRVLALQPATPNREFLQLFIARAEAGLAGDAQFAVPPNLTLAIQMAERARADFAALEREASDPEVRKVSRIERAKVPNPEELQRRLQPVSDQ